MPCLLGRTIHEGRRNGFEEIFSGDATDEIVELSIASFIHKVVFEEESKQVPHRLVGNHH